MKLKKLTALLLAVCMAGAITGCGGSSSSMQAAGAQSTGAAPAGSTAGSTAADDEPQGEIIVTIRDRTLKGGKRTQKTRFSGSRHELEA